MPERIRHALRFALPTIFAIYLLGALWNAVDVFVLGDADPRLGPARTFWFDEGQWRVIALTLGGVVFLWKVGDMEKEPPSWKYAIWFSVWLAVATVGTAIAMMERNGWLAAAVVSVAVALWLVYRRRLPGRPGTAGTVRQPPERDLR